MSHHPNSRIAHLERLAHQARIAVGHAEMALAWEKAVEALRAETPRPRIPWTRLEPKLALAAHDLFDRGGDIAPRMVEHWMRNKAKELLA